MYEFFQGLFQNGINALYVLFTWIGSMIESFFGALKTVLITLFQPVVAFFLGIAYMLAKCFHIAVLVVQVIFGLFKVVFGVILGVFNTFASCWDSEVAPITIIYPRPIIQAGMR